MATRYSFLHSEVLEKTGYVVSCLSRKRADLLFPLLDRDFIWMGHNDRPYLIGRDAFLAAFHLQPPLPSISLSEEEYHILTHKYSLWVVYGCHTETFHQADGSSLIRRVRNTYVWKQLRGELSLLHIHSSFPDIEDISPLNPFFDGKTTASFRQNFPSGGPASDDFPRILLRGTEGARYFLSPREIIFIRAQGTLSTVHTLSGDYQVRNTLSSLEKNLAGFWRVHRSWLVNRSWIRSIRRYRAILWDQEEVPIGKDRYLSLRSDLETLSLNDPSGKNS